MAPGDWPAGFLVAAGDGQVEWKKTTGAIRLTAAAAGEAPTVEIPLGNWPREAAAHLVFEVESVDLVRGVHAWQDGRVALIWRDAAGEVLPGHRGIVGGDGVRVSLPGGALIEVPGGDERVIRIVIEALLSVRGESC